MADFELLAPGGHQKLVDEVVDRLDLKADIDGYYAQLTAGAADNLTGRGDATTAEFLYRTAGGTADIETGQAVVKSIHGHTLGWNQLMRITGNGVTKWGLTETRDTTNNVVTITGTASDYGNFNSIGAPNVQGHKYLIYGHSSNYSLVRFSSQSYGADEGGGRIIINNSTNKTWYYTFVIPQQAVGQEINVTLRPQIFDLTAMFGAGNEPNTVAEFEALFPEPYYPYDAGSLLPVNMLGIESTGFNQWDGEIEQGLIFAASGLPSSSGYTEYRRSKSYVPVFPDTDYYFKSTGTLLYVVFYDADKNPIRHTSDSYSYIARNQVQRTPANAHYLRFNGEANKSIDDICINLSWSGRRNGEYEAFWKSQRLIDVASYFPDGMRSAGSVYDELTSTEAIQRVGVVDLGTLEWNYNADWGGYPAFWSPSLREVAMPNIIMTAMPAIKCDAIETVSRNTLYDNSKNGITLFGSAQADLSVRYSGATTAEEFKAAMSGVMLYYALATPTVTPIDPPLNLSYRVDDFGTERIMVPEDERSAPPVLDIAYGLNVVDFVRRAPTQYISAASFAQYLLARDAHDGTTTTMTWDDTDNRYEFAITDTVTEG